MQTDWSAALDILQRLSRRLRARRLLRRGLWLLAALCAAGCLLLLAAHRWPPAAPWLAGVEGLLALAALFVLLPAGRAMPLFNAAWLADRRLGLPEQAMSALQAPDTQFGALLRARTTPLLCAAQPAALAPWRCRLSSGVALSAAGCLAALLLLLGRPDGDGGAAAEREARARLAGGLRQTARTLDTLGDDPLARAIEQLARELLRAPDRRRAEQLAARGLNTLQSASGRAREARRALEQLSREPALGPAVEAARAGDRTALRQQLERLVSSGKPGAGLEPAARALRQAASRVRDPKLARELQRVARLAAARQAATTAELAGTLRELSSQAASLERLELAVARVERTVRSLGGSVPPAEEDHDEPGRGATGGGLPAGKPLRTRGFDPALPLPPPIARRPGQIEQLLEPARWPLAEDRLVRGYLRSLHERD